ncbi:MAG: response regulator transcription factor [Hyphomonadaceae bacterium]
MSNLNPAPKVLLVEDDERLAPLVCRHLTESGFHVRHALDTGAADAMIGQAPADLVILDVMLPGEDGLSMCRRLRQNSNVGIIMVTARGKEADRLLGLGLGADDYLAKPFSLWELEARARAVLRRCAAHTSSTDHVRSFGPLSIDLDQRLVRVQGGAVELTRSEFDLLALLTEQPGRVLSRESLLSAVQGGESEAFDRAVDTHMSKLRRKLERDPKTPRFLKTVWGVGYRFDPQ